MHIQKMICIVILYIGIALSRFVTISPKQNPEHVLAFKNRSSTYTFTITHRRKLGMSNAYSAVPLVVRRSDGLYELYFKGHRLCFIDNILDVCLLGDSFHGRWEINRTFGKDYMLKNNGKCMLVNRYSIFMSRCDENEPKQLFTIKGVESPVRVSPIVDEMARNDNTITTKTATERTYMKISEIAPMPEAFF